MHPYGSMYLLIDNTYNTDKWGILQTNNKGKQTMDEGEKQPRVDPKSYRPFYSIRVRTWHVDDPSMDFRNGVDISYLQRLSFKTQES